jgi:glycosyltransferase involved in cell wall biosynthesis
MVYLCSNSSFKQITLYADFTDLTSPNMRILQILPALNSGGVERGCLEINQALIDSGNKSYVISSGGSWQQQISDAGGVHITKDVKSKNPLLIRKNINFITQIINRYKIDVVHARSRAPAWSAYFATKQTNTPFITTYHGNYSYSPLFYKQKYNGVMVKGQTIIAVSHYIKSYILQHHNIKQEKIVVIPRGVDINKFNIANIDQQQINAIKAKYRLNDCQIILLPARYTPWKGQLTALQAIAEIYDHLPRNTKIVLIGDATHKSYKNKLCQYIQLHNLNDKVLLLPSQNDIENWYYLANVVLCPALRPEAFGRTAVEAQAMGTPVIGSNMGGMTETIIHNKTGFLYDDVSAMQNYIQQCLTKNHITADTCISHIHENYSISKMQRHTLNVYQQNLR